MGISGSGKTSHLMCVRDEFSKQGLKCDYVHIGGGRFRFFSFPLLCLLKKYVDGSEPLFFKEIKLRSYPNLNGRKFSLSSLWKLLLFLDMFLLVKITSARYFWFSRNNVILFDRYIFDAISDLMLLSNDHSFISRFMHILLIITRPDVVVLLDIDEMTALERMHHTTKKKLEYLERKRLSLRAIASVLRSPILQSHKSFEEVHHSLKELVKNRLISNA